MNVRNKMIFRSLIQNFKRAAERPKNAVLRTSDFNTVFIKALTIKKFPKSIFRQSM